MLSRQGEMVEVVSRSWNCRCCFYPRGHGWRCHRLSWGCCKCHTLQEEMAEDATLRESWAKMLSSKGARLKCHHLRGGYWNATVQMEVVEKAPSKRRWSMMPSSPRGCGWRRQRPRGIGWRCSRSRDVEYASALEEFVEDAFLQDEPVEDATLQEMLLNTVCLCLRGNDLRCHSPREGGWRCLTAR